MKLEQLHRKLARLEPWHEDFGSGMERRGKDGMSWYDLSINLNSAPEKAKSAIIVTSWMGQLKWLRTALQAYRETGAFVILAFDNPFYPWMRQLGEEQAIRCLPSPVHYLLANAVVTKHITYDADKRNGWFWSCRYAQGILRQFRQLEAVYVTNGDCVFDKPSGWPELLNLLKDCDLIAGQSRENKVHTADMLFRAEAFHKVYDYMAELMRYPVLGSRSPEGNLIEAVRQTGIRLGHAAMQPYDPSDGTIDDYARYGQDSTWRRIVGFRNLFAEQETIWNEGRAEPLPASYVDPYHDWIYFSGEERETLCKYYETGDRRYLMQWWDRGEDSWYNRLYYPLEFYGAEPIHANGAG